MRGGLLKDKLSRLHRVLAASGAMPGRVALVTRGGDVHIEALGTKDFGDATSIGCDAILRIAALTKPVSGTASGAGEGYTEDRASSAAGYRHGLAGQRVVPSDGGRELLRRPPRGLPSGRRTISACTSRTYPTQ